MLDEPRTHRRAGQQCPSTFNVSPFEIVDTVRNFIDLGLRLDKQRTYQGLGHETFDDCHTSRGKRRSNIGRRRVRSSGTVGHAEPVVVTPSVSEMWSDASSE